ncbi:MAG: ABC transporter ATP-binding protein [Candidatus Eisenbacteria bacterium]
MLAPTVSLRDITRTCGTVIANDRVSLELAPGQVHAIVGENGAGKTTLMKVLFGLFQPDSGDIVVDGRAVRLPGPGAAMRLGLGMVHQHFMLVDTLTVTENVVLGREPMRGLGVFDRARAEHEVAALAERYRLPVDPRARIAQLSVGAQQRVEILKALYRGARVLILDEPTAVLTPQEVDELFGVLRALQQDGASIVLITHKLAEVKALADQVTVLRAGRVVGGGRVAQMTTEAIAELMVGRVLAPLKPRSARSPGAPQLEAHALEVADDRGLPAVRGVSFQVRGGEVVGLAGVDGNGQHELLEALAGVRRPSAGRIVVGGRAVSGRDAREHRRAGLANIPSDRLKRGLVADMTLAENLVLGRQDEASHGPWLGGPALNERARGPLAEFDVRPPEPTARAAQLSGGNQQKLIAARELGARSRGAEQVCAILAAHPTRGVDLGAIEFLHGQLLAAREAGRAVLLVSSELSEILALSDRILVLFEGRIVHETTPGATDERTLGQFMTGRSAPQVGPA